MAGAASSTCAANDFEHNVFGRHAGANIALHAHFHCLGLLQKQRLRGEHMLYLAGANAKGQRAKPAVTSRVAIPADDRGAGQRKALLWPHDMDNALFLIRRANIANAKSRGVAFQRLQLRSTFGIRNGDWAALRIQARRCWQIMIGHCQCQIRATHFAARNTQPLKCLWAGDFMHQMAINKDQAGAIVTTINDVGIPDFFIQCARA